MIKKYQIEKLIISSANEVLNDTEKIEQINEAINQYYE